MTPITRLVPGRQIAYLSSHPLAAAVSSGIATQGFLNIVAPTPESIASLVFSLWIYYLFNAVWMAGGLLAAIGLLRGHRAVEAAGSFLLAGGTAVYFTAVAAERGLDSRSAIFVLFMALGYALRVRHLVTAGYVEGHA